MSTQKESGESADTPRIQNQPADIKQSSLKEPLKQILATELPVPLKKGIAKKKKKTTSVSTEHGGPETSSEHDSSVSFGQKATCTGSKSKQKPNQEKPGDGTSTPRHTHNRYLQLSTSEPLSSTLEDGKKRQHNRSLSKRNEKNVANVMTKPYKEGPRQKAVSPSPKTAGDKVKDITHSEESTSNVQKLLVRAQSTSDSTSPTKKAANAPLKRADVRPNPASTPPAEVKELPNAQGCSESVQLASKAINVSSTPVTERRTPLERRVSDGYPDYLTATSAKRPPKARRCLSFCGGSSTTNIGRLSLERGVASVNVADIVENTTWEGVDVNSSSSIDSLKNLNLDLRDHVTRLKYQLEAQRGSIKQAQWQKVLDIRHLRMQENKRLTLALIEQREKLDKEKARELEHLRDQLANKAESDLQKLARTKDTEITKLKMEVSCKDTMIQRLIGENKHARVKLNIDIRKTKLMDDLKELKLQKKELEESLTSATSAERAFSDDLRKHCQNFESEIAKVKREAQLETKHLLYAGPS